MKSFLTRLHARVGDFWWYSAMIFLACRSGDAINAFIGLWLVPKYVGPQELGAVLPLQQLTSFLTVPLGVVAIVFSKQVNTYAAHGEYGKVKGFIRDVLAISAVLFVLCIGGAYLIMPFFYERLKIASGLLTVLILASGFVGSIGSLVGAAQQGLKRFKMMTIANLISSPIRLVTMLVAMPIRPLSGYIVGQTTPGIATTALSALDTRKALAPYTPDHTWRRDWKKIWQYTWPLAIFTAIGIFNGTLHATVIRQRLPEIESAAFYMFSRFAEIANYVGASALVILFPLASELHESGKDNSKILRHSIIGVVASTAVLAIFFEFSRNYFINLIPIWSTYSKYSYLLPWMTIGMGTASLVGIFISFETANNRFSAIMPVQFLNIGYAFFIISFTGYTFFNGILPPCVIDFMRWADIAHLDKIVYISNIWNIIQLAIFYLLYRINKNKESKNVRS